MCESCSERFVAGPFAGGGLELVYVGCDLAFTHVEVDTKPFAELFDDGKERYHVFYRVGDERAVIGVPFTGEFESA